MLIESSNLNFLFEFYNSYLLYLEVCLEHIAAIITVLSIIFTSAIIYISFMNLNNLEKLPTIDLIAEDYTHKLNHSAIILSELKTDLPEVIAKRVVKIGFYPSSMKEVNVATCNLNYKDVKKDNYAIIISEGALRNLTPIELQAILAHELSHIILNHLTRGYLVISAIRQVNFSIFCSSAISMLLLGSLNFYGQQKQLEPVIALFLLSVLWRKLFSVHAQAMELQADDLSIHLNENIPALLSGIEKCEALNKNNRPFLEHVSSMFFSTHPDVLTGV